MHSISQRLRIKPPALLPGDTVGIVAPASNIQRGLLEKGCDTLRSLGYKPFYLDSIFDKDLYFAGSIERRVGELDVKGIAAHPKIFIGYSDISTLLTYITDSTGLVTFHGPMVTKDFAVADGLDLASWRAALTGVSKWHLDSGADSGVKPLVEGEGEGILYGGCLSMIAASLGTPCEVRTADTILFMEDVATKPYQIDRMLMQLKLAGKLAGVRGIVLGEMLDCVQTKQDQDYTLEEVVVRLVGDLGVPVAYGLRSGHVSRKNVTLPLGVRASLKVGKQEVSLK